MTNKNTTKMGAAASRARAGIAVVLASMGVAACSWIGGSKPKAPLNPDPYPVNYRKQIVTMLTTTLTDRAAFMGALIAPPMLRLVPEGRDQHYVVCLQLESRHGIKGKVVVFLHGAPNEFIDSTPQECAGAQYQPFPELAAARPSR